MLTSLKSLLLAALLWVCASALAAQPIDDDFLPHNLIIFSKNGNVSYVPFRNLKACWNARTSVLQTLLVVDAFCVPVFFIGPAQ